MEADIPNRFSLVTEKAEKYAMDELSNCIYSVAHLNGHDVMSCRGGGPISNALRFFPLTLLRYFLIYTLYMNR